MRLLLGYPLEKEHLRQIQSVAGDYELVEAEQEQLGGELPKADLFCGHVKTPVEWEQVVAAGRLQWIQSSAAGLDHCLHPAIVESDIVVTSASGVLADQVAEHAVGLISATLRSFPVFFAAQQRREFVRRPTRDLHNSSVGIVGFGGVGRRLSELLAPYRVRIVATDYFSRTPPPHVEAIWPPERLDQLLTESDIVVLCVPLTAATRGLIAADQLTQMRSGAVLVNVSRGEVVVERDLVAALASRQIAGAAIDVTQQEPLPPESGLWELSNVLITPHVAGQSGRRIDEMTKFFCENLRRYQNREPLLNLVDKRLGFPAPTAS
jgi:D-3-phosphoglycerate dehydrogenase